MERKFDRVLKEIEKEGIRLMTMEDIENYLKSLVVGENGVMPVRYFSFVVPEPNYDPDSFSQEIEDSEEEIDLASLLKEEMAKPEFDFIWNNTICRIPRNSKLWSENHAKMCLVKLLPNRICEACTNHGNVRDYYSENMLDKIRKIIEEYGGIIKIG